MERELIMDGLIYASREKIVFLIGTQRYEYRRPKGISQHVVRTLVDSVIDEHTLYLSTLWVDQPGRVSRPRIYSDPTPWWTRHEYDVLVEDRTYLERGRYQFSLIKTCGCDLKGSQGYGTCLKESLDSATSGG